jgi:hypothetical protein
MLATQFVSRDGIFFQDARSSSPAPIPPQPGNGNAAVLFGAHRDCSGHNADGLVDDAITSDRAKGCPRI